MQAKVQWNRKLGFVGISGTNHSVVMDVTKENGGDGAAPSPMEMVLFGLAGCSGIDVALIARRSALMCGISVSPARQSGLRSIPRSLPR